MQRLILFCVVLVVGNCQCATVEQKLNYLDNSLKTLTRQVMLQQFFSEQRVRSEGHSGVKTTRLRKDGSKNYFSDSHNGYAAAAVHDHANNDRTVGMGELTAVLNGIEFKTRHNDYRLYMPHRTSKNLNAFERVPFPDVPPEVTSKATVDEQVVEMRKWFKAWRDQDTSERDYRKYFKPVLCYLEGAWTQSSDKINEPFESDRHFIDAASWMELHEKARYVAYAGTKDRNENLSWMPTKIIGLVNDTVPRFAQWNYRIMCHPVKRDIPLERLRVVEDLASRMMTNRDILQHTNSRAGRFQLNTKDMSAFHDKAMNWKSLIDELMEEIPGKDNYQGNNVRATSY